MSSFVDTTKKRIFIWIVGSLAFLLLLSAFTAVYYLKKGIRIDNVNVGAIVASDCFLIWNDKLELQVSEISVGTTQQSEKGASSAISLRRGVQAGYYLARLFSRFSIAKVSIGENHYTIDLSQEKFRSHLLVLGSDTVALRSLFTFKKNTIDVEIIEAAISDFNSKLTGALQLDDRADQLTGTLSAVINDSFPVSVNFTADSKQLAFQGKEAGKIIEIKSLVDLFGLGPNIQRWITDYLAGSRYHLKSLTGTVPWDNPKEILSTLEAEVRVTDTEYVFAQGLEPIKAKYTDVYFQQGVLIIKPHDATFYGQSCGESWLDINFNDSKNILLTAYIKTRAVANDDILTLLNHYKIGLPFKQVEGKTETDLRLAITLNKRKIEAQGVFEIDDGIIDWSGTRYRAENARINLVNSDVTIERLKLSYKDLFAAQVSGTIQARKKSGDLNILLEQLTLKAGDSLVDIDKTEPVQGRYLFSPEGHVLESGPSVWLLDSTKMDLGAFRAPVFLDDMAMQLPPVQLKSSSGGLFEISGYFSIKKKQVDLSWVLLEYDLKDMKLLNPPIGIDIDYDNGLVISTTEISRWNLSQMPVTLYPTVISYGDEVFKVDKSRISYGTLFDSHLAGYYSQRTKQGGFILDKIEVTGSHLLQRLEIGERVDVEVTGSEETIVIYFPVLDLSITTDKQKRWSAAFGDLSKTYNHFSIQKKTGVKEGSLVVSSANGKSPYDFSAKIVAPYPLFVESDSPINQLHITGRLTDEAVFATVNKDVVIEYLDRNLTISSSELGYNISAIILLLQELPKTSVDEDDEQLKPFQLNLKAANSQVYLSPNSRILADTIDLNLDDGKLKMELNHGPGKILLQLEKGVFLIDGTELNDEFMGALIQNSSFEGGRMSLSSMGTFDEFSVVLKIDDTIMKNLASLNNVMAFINTVPALLTFSPAEYNMIGLPINSALIGMKYKEKIATFESMEVVSPTMQGKGAGTIDFTSKLMDIDFNIKIQAGKNMRKIPVLGYILAKGDEDASLSLKIEGGYNDPKVSTSIVKEIVTYPFEVLYRTLNLPFHLAGKGGKRSSENGAGADTSATREQTEGQTE